MKNSKEYMVEGEYEKAVEQLNLAIIENPTDKNAAALLDTITIDEAKEILPEAKLKYKEAKELFDEYNLINSSYATATESLFQISDNSVELLENIIENVVKPLPTIPPNSTRLFRLTSRTESNDSRIKASFNKSTIETFISEFDLYYVSIMRQEE
ncbi:tetratricopeptide (TPR) repeat protein [Paenibacillus harenae]|nr:tetratricopeptide (TPR) repeat protein [Paenibacillus harenae]